MNPNQAVLFDLDGTLLDTLQDLADSGNEVLESRGFPPRSLEEYRTIIGGGMVALVQDIFPDDHRPEEGPETDAVLAAYREAYGRNWQRNTVPFPGIAELLDELAAREIPIGVLSNKAHDFTVKCVETFLGKWEWQVVFGAREGVAKKPDPAGALEAADRLAIAPSDCFYLGDSDVDMMMAANAGMRGIGVSWGFRSVEELKAAGAQQVISSPQELLEILA